MAKYEILDSNGVFGQMEAKDHKEAVMKVIERVFPEGTTVIDCPMGQKPYFVVRGQRSTKYYSLAKKEKNEITLDSLNKLDRAIAKAFIPSADTTVEPPNNIVAVSMWLDSDVECALLNGASLKGIDGLFKEKIGVSLAKFDTLPTNKKGNFDLERIKQAVAIRKDFKKALEGVKKGTSLSKVLGWGFSRGDVEQLAKLHKDGNKAMKQKIEDLLEDCNFHTECADFSEGNYKEYIK